MLFFRIKSSKFKERMEIIYIVWVLELGKADKKKEFKSLNWLNLNWILFILTPLIKTNIKINNFLVAAK
jgi:hypothetical protein